jgi:hypothetical protein
MCFGMIWSKRDGGLQHSGRLRKRVLTQIRETQIQEQIPLVEPKPCGLKIFAGLFCGTFSAVCKTQMIMRKRIVSVRA